MGMTLNMCFFFFSQVAEGVQWLLEQLVRRADAGTENDADPDLAECPADGDGEAVLNICS